MIAVRAPEPARGRSVGAVRWVAVLAAIAVVAAVAVWRSGDGQQLGDDDLSLDALGIDWPADTLDAGDPPPLPDGFDATRYDDMAETMKTWARATTLDPDVRISSDPAVTIGTKVPAAIASQIRQDAEQAAAPRLAAANVFSRETVLDGKPRVSTAWKVSTGEQDGAPALTLELQTRAAYPVRIDDGPPRVIGVLRVHRLITRQGDTGPYGVGFDWQEFGASDCTLARSDALQPDSDLDRSRADLKTFVEIGDSDQVTMPKLGAEDVVDDAFVKQCASGSI